jgi:hypothetical protein
LQTAILHTIRHHPQVKGSLRFTALELSYRFNTAGICRVAYQYLAKRTGYHVRTIIRHVAKLVKAGLIRKTVTRCTRYRCERNLYTYCGPRDALPKRVPSDRGRQATTPKREKLTREEEIRNMRWGLARWTPGTPQHQACLTRLQQLLRE